jgi:hypothetical protein
MVRGVALDRSHVAIMVSLQICLTTTKQLAALRLSMLTTLLAWSGIGDAALQLARDHGAEQFVQRARKQTRHLVDDMNAAAAAATAAVLLLLRNMLNALTLLLLLLLLNVLNALNALSSGGKR